MFPILLVNTVKSFCFAVLHKYCCCTLFVVQRLCLLLILGLFFFFWFVCFCICMCVHFAAAVAADFNWKNSVFCWCCSQMCCWCCQVRQVVSIVAVCLVSDSEDGVVLSFDILYYINSSLKACGHTISEEMEYSFVCVCLYDDILRGDF